MFQHVVPSAKSTLSENKVDNTDATTTTPTTISNELLDCVLDRVNFFLSFLKKYFQIRKHYTLVDSIDAVLQYAVVSYFVMARFVVW